MKKAVIVPGWGANVNSHWFGWLKAQLESKGIKTTVVDLPTPLMPDFDEWQNALREQVGQPDEDTLLISHSMGGVTLLHYLTQTAPEKIGGLIVAAGFYEKTGVPAEVLGGFSIDDYVGKTQVDLDKIRAMTPHQYAIISNNDQATPPAYSERLAEKLGAKILVVENGGHLMESDGVTEFRPFSANDYRHTPQNAQPLYAALCQRNCVAGR